MFLLYDARIELFVEDMGIANLIRYAVIGETCTLAEDEQGYPVGVFLERVRSSARRRLLLGDTVEARVTDITPKQGGAYLQARQGDALFLSGKSLDHLVCGAVHNAKVVAEARRDKVARVVFTHEVDDSSPFKRWLAGLPRAAQLSIVEADEAPRRIDEILEDVLAPSVSLPGGGRIQITPTPALVAVDVDTAGRNDSGRATMRALAVNIEAAQTLARQLALRDLGGAVVLDCIGPLSRHDGPKVKAAFLDAFRAISTRRVQCLNPSPFGLMEIALAWGRQPLHERLQEAGGTLTASSQMHAGLRRLQMEASAAPGARIRLALPREAFTIFKMYEQAHIAALNNRFGARIEIVESVDTKMEVFKV